MQCEAIVSRNQAQKLLKSGYVKLNGKILKPSFKLEQGQTIEILIPQTKSGKLEPYDFPLDILHEDSEVIVINKPAGLVVHPAHGHETDTLINALVHHCKDLSVGFTDDRPGLVHRLDRDTSGTMVIAKTDHAQTSLAKQFKNKTTYRRYWCIVYGELRYPVGRIESKIARHPTDRKRFSSLRREGSQRPYLEVTELPDTFFESKKVVPSKEVQDSLEEFDEYKENARLNAEFEEVRLNEEDGPGKVAISNYRVLIQSHEFSLVEMQLETGRTHQIRVHLSETGHPIVGDDMYGGKARVNNCKSVHLRKYVKEMNRFALHARELGFMHPTEHERVHFTSNWPDDLKELAEMCSIDFSTISE